MADTKVLSLRMQVRLAEEIDWIARIDGKSISGWIREAAEQQIQSRFGDPEFQQRLKTRLEKDALVVRRIAAATNQAEAERRVSAADGAELP